MPHVVSHDEQRRIRSKRVLLVEDNQDEVTLFERALRAAELAPVLEVIPDAEAAEVRLFDRSGDQRRERPDLILVDIDLARSDGLALVRRVRADARLRRIPVIVFTSSDTDHDVRRGYQLGANSYVRKPTNFAVLEQLVSQLCLYWLAVNRPAPQIIGDFS